MKYIRLPSTDPYENLAIEEYLLRTETDDIFLLWQNDKTVVIGKNQNAYAEVDLAYAKAHGIRIARRITGGGAVYHDLGNLNYTFITDKAKARVLDYAYFTKPIISALSSLSVEVTLGGRNDILWDGKKISGNAQYVGEDRILHHGTLLFDTDVSVMASVLRVNEKKLSHHAVKSHEGRVSNLKDAVGCDIETFISKIEEAVIRDSGAEKCPPPQSNAEISALKARNQSPLWLYSDKRYLTQYQTVREGKYPFGIVHLDIAWEKEKIARIVISGDFFSIAPIEEAEAFLAGKTVEDIAFWDVSPYIHGMRTEQFLSLLTQE